jgi:hypothetical protein
MSRMLLSSVAPHDGVSHARRDTWLAFLAATAVFAFIPLLLLRDYRQGAFDLGIYDQSLWLLLNGSTFNTVGGAHLFGAHFSPLLLLLAPIALVPGGAAPELLLQALVLAASVFPLARICEHFGQPVRPFLVAFIVHPGVFTAAWYGFHPWTLAAPFLLAGVAATLDRPRWTTLMPWALAALAFREDMAFWMVLFGLLLTLAGRLPWDQWLAGAMLPGLASLFVVAVLLPSVSPDSSYLYGSSLLVEPSPVSPSAFLSSSAIRILYLLLPFGFGLSGWRKLRIHLLLPLAIPLIGLGLKGGNALITVFHYDLHLAIGVFIAVLATPGLTPHTTRAVVSALTVALFLGALRPTTPWLGPNPWGLGRPDAEVFRQTDGALHEFVNEGTSLSVPSRLVPSYSERDRIYIFPWPFDAPSHEPRPMACPPPEVVVADMNRDDTPGWDTIKDEYFLQQTIGHLGVFTYAGDSDTSGACFTSDVPRILR